MRRLFWILGLLGLTAIQAFGQGSNVAGSPGTNVNGAGGIGLPANGPGIPPANGNIFYASNYGVKADTYVVYDAVCSNGSNIVTSATAHFQTVAKIKVGQIIWAIPGAGIGGSVPSVPKTTVQSIDSDTQIHTVGNGIAGCTTGNALIWGDDDTAALNTAWAATIAGINCGSLYLPSGIMMVSAGVMNTPLPATCGSANLFNNAVTVIGTGWQNTTLAPTPDFDLTTCSGSGRVACFNANAVSIFNLQINGYGLLQTSVPGTTANLISVFSPANLVNFSCQDFATSDTNVTGIAVTNFIFWLTDLQAATCGGISVNFSSAAAGSAIIGSYIVPGNGTSPTIASNSPGADFYSTWWGISGVTECAVNFTGYAHEFGEPAQPGAEICVNGGHLTLSGGIVSHNQGIANRAALKITNSGVVQASDETFIDSGAGEFAVSVDATSTFIDGCGNTFTGNINVATGGKFIPCPGAIYPSGPSQPVLTGTGACATFSTQTGTIYYGAFKCTGTTGAATITLTTGTTATNGFRCQASDTTTAADTITTGTLSATSCAFSAAAIVSGDVISFSATPF